MAKKNVLTIRVPEDLKDRLEKAAALQGVSLNQLALYAFTRELSELESAAYFKKYNLNQSKEEILSDFDDVLGRVKAGKVPSWDKN